MVDSVMSPDDWSKLYESSGYWLEQGADAVLAVTPERDRDDAPLWVTTDQSDRVVAIGPEAAAAAGHVTGGVYGFTEAARARAAETLASGRHHMRIFLHDLVASGADVRGVEIPRIIDIDHRNDLEKANTYMQSLVSTETLKDLP
jgi:hypothetical protein